MAESKSPTSKEVWDTLSKIDVSKHTEEKMGLTYLSWAWAWGVLKDHYPSANYLFEEWEYTLEPNGAGEGPREITVDYRMYPDGTGSVECKVFIGDVWARMWLPVMDNRNHPVVNPSSRAVSDAKMRCLVKAIAILGLGHYIYAGEDLPETSTETTAKKVNKKLSKTVDKKVSSSQKDRSKDSEVNKEPMLIDLPEPTYDVLITPQDSGVQLAYQSFVEECSNIDELKSFWKDNQEELEKLEKVNKDMYKEILSIFSSKKKELS